MTWAELFEYERKAQDEKQEISYKIDLEQTARKRRDVPATDPD